MKVVVDLLEAQTQGGPMTFNTLGSVVKKSLVWTENNFSLKLQKQHTNFRDFFHVRLHAVLVFFFFLVRLSVEMHGLSVVVFQ